MSNIVGSQQVGKQVCEALGIDPNGVTEIFIRLAVDEAVQVTVGSLVSGDQVDGLCSVIKRYHLTERK